MVFQIWDTWQFQGLLKAIVITNFTEDFGEITLILK